MRKDKKLQNMRDADDIIGLVKVPGFDVGDDCNNRRGGVAANDDREPGQVNQYGHDRHQAGQRQLNQHAFNPILACDLPDK